MIAAASAALALVLGYRLVSYALVLLGVIELGAWVVIRRDGAFRVPDPDGRPVLGSDRGVLAAAFVAAVAAGIAAAIRLFRLSDGQPLIPNLGGNRATPASGREFCRQLRKNPAQIVE